MTTPHAFLLIPRIDGSTQEWPLVGARTLLGRAPECDIVLDGKLISRHHAQIVRDGQKYAIEDLGSRNGTSLNGRPIVGQQSLHDGDTIDLGGATRLVFSDRDSTNTRPMPSAVGVWIDMTTQEVWVNGERLDPPLSLAQFNLVRLLVARADQICTREEIVAAVWPEASEGVSDEAIDALVKRVRARFAAVPHGQHYLRTIRGRGLLLRRDGERQ